MPQDDWHLHATDSVLTALDTTPDGLNADEAELRLREHGPNELVDNGTRHPIHLLREQLTAVMVLILLGAGFLSLLLGKYLEAGAIFVIVALFAILGFIQEYRAEQAIAALRSMASPQVRVVRSGRSELIDARDLVPGDVVALEAGNVVPADLRLIETANLRVQEAALTGESEPVEKDTETIAGGGATVALGDRRNLAYLGTQVTYGRGRGVVVATGMRTELGRIARLLGAVTPELTPLQRRLDSVGKQLALGGVGVAGLVMLLGALGGESLGDLVLTAISVAVAVIPEGLPAVVTFTLAIGAQRMLRRQALIRKLPAVETLGSVTVICSDKTGTLTENRMTATVVETPDERIAVPAAEDGSGRPIVPALAESRPGTRLALVAGVLCNDAEAAIDADGRLERSLGDPTEVALLVAAERAGVDAGALAASVPREAERPFDSERKRMSTLHRVDAVAEAQPELAAVLTAVADGAAHVSFVKGAPDMVLAVATHTLHGDTVRPLDADAHARLSAANDAMAAQGMRVLALAARGVEHLDVEVAEHELTVLGLVGIIDPPRAAARDAVTTCRQAGIRPVMITGDHPLTAAAIARDLGIADDGRAVTGAEIEVMDDERLREVASEVSVFARVAPEHKLRIVAALQDSGQVVAMTGDGVNDAPALKRADIGVAMGITGTDVSKEASDMVLRDDNFATIVAAVEEGRVIYDNLRRFVTFAVAGNIGKMIVMLGWPIPFLIAGSASEGAIALLPLQLLWLNLMTDGLLGLSMGVEPAERGVMRRSPTAPGASIWSGGLGARTIGTGLLIGAAALGVGFAYHAADLVQANTMMFTTLAVLQVFQAFGTRSATESLRSIGLGGNRLMLVLAGVVVALQGLAVYSPLNGFLDLEPLRAVDLAVCFGLGLLLLGALEGWKALQRRRADLPAVQAAV